MKRNFGRFTFTINMFYGRIENESVHKLQQWTFGAWWIAFLLSSFLEEKVFTTLKTKNSVKIKSFEKIGKMNKKKKSALNFFLELKEKGHKPSLAELEILQIGSESSL